jgi:hypothetical protein
MAFTHIDAVFCQNCAMVITNGDASGIEDAEAHLSMMENHLDYPAIIGNESPGFRQDDCDGCGQRIISDQWFTGWLDATNA